jgi:hypothetical protein
MEKIKDFSFYKHRIRSALEEGVVDKDQPEKASKLIKEILNKKNGKYKKLVACVQLIKQTLPTALSESLVKKLDQKDFSHLPFNPKKFILKNRIGAGYVSKVYLLESQIEDQPSFVLKLDFCHYGNTEKLQQIAKQNNQDHKFICQYYQDLPNLVPPELSFIATAQKNKQPIIATIQEFAGSDIRDVFNDFSQPELVKLLKKDNDLRQDFIKFIDLTLALAEKQQKAIDLLGEKNLVIVKDRGKYYLKFLDPHLISPLTKGTAEREQRLQEAINYLKNIKEKVSEKE